LCRNNFHAYGATEPRLLCLYIRKPIINEMKTQVLVTVLIITSTLTSCNLIFDCIDGNGILRTEERAASSITAIANETSFDVIFARGDETSITVEAESNIIPYIETSISGDALTVSTVRGCHCLRYNTRPVVTVTAPFISELVNSGSGDIVADQLAGEEVKVTDSGSGDITVGTIGCTEASFTVSGSGDVSTDIIDATSVKAVLSGSGTLAMKGSTETARYRLSGSGSLFARDLETLQNNITVSGSGSVHATVIESLEAVISGSGNIYLKGEPTVNLTRTGSGRIIYQ
jgi:hypothetical protein